ncbi:hypothetical protein NLJ89_g11050 [Agrocybe chaxingu]|uniref:Uncharacterized protein n=1 Tax=Agrocybe chaxingu TaxID=84603 RepID=A0A9W8MRI7_9AGAR|nr:hypothetical protein NLJ89_g11050 [Agrocybe chaxingu]
MTDYERLATSFYGSLSSPPAAVPTHHLASDLLLAHQPATTTSDPPPRLSSYHLRLRSHASSNPLPRCLAPQHWAKRGHSRPHCQHRRNIDKRVATGVGPLNIDAGATSTSSDTGWNAGVTYHARRPATYAEPMLGQSC